MCKEASCSAFDFWCAHHTAPYHFPMDSGTWFQSMYEDIDGDGRQLFDTLTSKYSRTAPHKSGSINGHIEYGVTAFGFDDSGDCSDQIHYKVIRDISFPPDAPEIGQKLLDAALAEFGTKERIYAYFHYFGMSACARHGKLHESQKHIHDLLLDHGFVVEHENIYYSRVLTDADVQADTNVTLQWRDVSPGSCREFAASLDGQEVCWGQVHFLPQKDIAYLRWIFTDGAKQHTGIGKRVMKQLFAELYALGIRRFDTDTARANTIAQHYYEKTGFQNEGITRSYYTA